ncbi:MAG: holo-ACP synthase [Oscillospiraceae bacterium]|nr:holo-ACP synthase [Oscillospiraceae bacterium]
MQIKVGIDLTEIDRIAENLGSEAFLRRVLGEEERAYYQEHGMRAESIAAAFAAKEAFSKAMGTGVRGFLLKEVQVAHDDLGRPFYRFSGTAAEMVEARGLTFELSLTHSKTTAAAVAVAYKED